MAKSGSPVLGVMRVSLLLIQSKKSPTAGVRPKCPECHQKQNQAYSKSRHAQVSKKICHSCHDPHYSIPFRQMSGHDRQKICLKCHESAGTHKWLPQKELHFNYVECTSCHDLNAEIGMVVYIVDRNDPISDQMLDYGRLTPFIGSGKRGLIETLDLDNNGMLSEPEISLFIKKLKENGIPGADLGVRIMVLKPAHNFASGGEETRDCSLCHSSKAKVYSKLFFELPEKDGGLRRIPLERQTQALLGEGSFLRNFYLLGESKIRADDLKDLLTLVRRIGFKWLDIIGVFLISIVLVAIGLHAMLMFFTRKLRTKLRFFEKAEPRPVAIRIWHWVHGFFVITLILTGIQLRFPDVLPIFATFLNAVNLHNLSGAIVIVDYIFWLCYHLRRRDFKSGFLIMPRDLVENTAEILHYYGYLIFVGEGYPRGMLHGSEFNPLEKVTFPDNYAVFLTSSNSDRGHALRFVHNDAGNQFLGRTPRPGCSASPDSISVGSMHDFSHIFAGAQEISFHRAIICSYFHEVPFKMKRASA